MILLSFAAAAAVLWFSPPFLGEFVFVGQLGLTVLALSVLELVFARLAGPSGH